MFVACCVCLVCTGSECVVVAHVLRCVVHIVCFVCGVYCVSPCCVYLCVVQIVCYVFVCRFALVLFCVFSVCVCRMFVFATLYLLRMCV